MGVGGGGVITKYSRGAGPCMYMWYILDIYKTHAHEIKLDHFLHKGLRSVNK